MNTNRKEQISTSTAKEELKRRYKGHEKPEQEIAFDEQISQVVSEDARNTMASLSFEQKHSLYLDIFKPLDF